MAILQDRILGIPPGKGLGRPQSLALPEGLRRAAEPYVGRLPAPEWLPYQPEGDGPRSGGETVIVSIVVLAGC